jgi:predicted enzyme involved in methoxymalonyl-ACP biosynthesis
MSCRVARKYVESALVYYFIQNFPKATTISFSGVKTEKNKLLVDCIREIGFEDISSNEQELKLIKDTKIPPLNYDIVSVTQ